MKRIGAAIACLGLAMWGKSHIDESKAAAYYGAPVVVPPAPVAKVAALGYYGFAADLYWLRLLEYFGDKRYRRENFSALVPLLELVVTLDPKLCIVYKQAGLILTSSEITDLESANRLLARGVEQCPDDFYAPFVLGFNLYYFQHRFAEAGEMLQLASRRPGAPEWLGDLALRVSAHGGDLEALETMLVVMVESEKDDEARKAVERRLSYVRTERLLRKIDTAVAEAKKRGQTASTVEDLQRLGLAPPAVRDPSGGTLSIGDDGRARSSTFEKRLEISKEALK